MPDGHETFVPRPGRLCLVLLWVAPGQLGNAGGQSHPGLMPDKKAPSSGAFLPASLMYFCSG